VLRAGQTMASWSVSGLGARGELTVAFRARDPATSMRMTAPRRPAFCRQGGVGECPAGLMDKNADPKLPISGHAAAGVSKCIR
jgi:hypothetical protein